MGTPYDTMYRTTVQISKAGFSGDSAVAGDCAITQPVHMIRPPLHHPYPLIPMLATGVGAAHIVALDMGKLAFDGVRVPLTGFFSRVEAMARKPWAVISS